MSKNFPTNLFKLIRTNLTAKAPVQCSLLFLLFANSVQASTAYDYNGDEKADIAVRRAADFTQYVSNSNDVEIQRITFGRDHSDIPVSGDFDGDGITDVAVRRASTQYWYIKNSSGQDLITDNDDGITRIRFGNEAEDIPVPADFDGDGRTDLAVRRPSSQYWYVLNSSGVDSVTDHSDGITRIQFGRDSADIPAVADYDGDGKADFAVRRPSSQFWYILNSSGIDALTGNRDGITRKRFGLREEDIPVPADFDGDKKADLAVRRPSNQFWYILNSTGSNYNSDKQDGIQRIHFGLQSDDIPIVADYDGDKINDIAVRRPSNQFQYILKSSDGQIEQLQFGLKPTDIPLAAPILTRMAMAATKDEAPETDDPETDALKPEATILFPSAVAGVEGADTIWVKGIATDNNGIANVLVNGVTAQIEVLQAKYADTNATEIQTSQSVAWEVNIPVSGEVVIGVEDLAGNLNSNAASSTLFTGEIPTAFTVDDDNNRFFGFRGNSPRLISVDLNTGKQSLTTSENGSLDGHHLVFASEENMLITSNYDFDDRQWLILSSIDPDTARKSELARYQVPKTTGDWSFFSIKGLEYSAPENSVYIHTHLFHDDIQNFSHIVKYDLTLDSFTVVIDGEFIFYIDPNDSEIYYGQKIYTDNMLWSDAGLFITNSIEIAPNHYGVPGIQRLIIDENPQGNDLMDEFSFYYSPRLLTMNIEDSDVLYDLGTDGLRKVDVNTGDVSVISESLNISQPHILDYDTANQRLLLHDWDLDMIVAFDSQTGAQSRFIHNGIGTGKALINPQKMALDESNNILYVADDQENAAEVIFAVDLNTGNRHVVGNINQRYNVTIEDLLLDHQNKTLYVLFSDNIMKIDLETDETQTIINVENSDFLSDTEIKSAELDTERNQLIVTVVNSLSLYGVDLSNGDVSVVSDGESVDDIAGTGDYISRDIVLTGTNDLVMLSIRNKKATLISIGLTSHNRIYTEDICTDVSAFQEELKDSPFTVYAKQKDELILKSNNALFSYNFNTDTCVELFRAQGGILLHDVVTTSQEQWYFTTRGTLQQLEIDSGQTVVVSK